MVLLVDHTPQYVTSHNSFASDGVPMSNRPTLPFDHDFVNNLQMNPAL